MIHRHVFSANPADPKLLLDLAGLLHIAGPCEPKGVSGTTRTLDLAVREELAPALGRLAHRGVSLPFSQGVIDSLEQRYLVTLRDHVAQAAEMGRILGAFHYADLPGLVLKGLALAHTVYQPGERTMVDVDLLIHEPDLPRAADLLADVGFQPSRMPRHALNTAFRRTYNTVTFRKPGIPWAIELHWNLFHPSAPFHIREEDLWCGAEKQDSEALSFSMPPWPASLLHLCMHAAYGHRFVPVRLVYDITRTVDYLGGDLDWDEVRLLARAWRGEHALALAMQLSRRLFGAPQPVSEVIASCLRPASPALVNYTLKHILTHPAQRTQSDRLHLDALLERGASLATLRYLATLLAPSPTLLRYHYSEISRNTPLPLAYARYWRRWFTRGLAVLYSKRFKRHGETSREERWERWLTSK